MKLIGVSFKKFKFEATLPALTASSATPVRQRKNRRASERVGRIWTSAGHPAIEGDGSKRTG
jgi:hypothetical protein